MNPYVLVRTTSDLRVTVYGPFRTERAANLAKQRIDRVDPYGDYLVVQVYPPTDTMRPRPQRGC